MEKLRKILGILLILGLGLVLTAPVFADSYSYYIPVEVTEIGGEAKTALPVVVDLSIQNLIDLGYLDSDGLDSRVKEGDTERDYMLVDSRFGFVLPTLGAFQSKEERLYTDYDPVSSEMDVVIGPSGYITIPDDSSTELGGNFEVELKGYIDTSSGSDKNLVYKEDAFGILISASGEITVIVYGSSSTSTTYDPEADGSINQNSLSGETARWRAMQDDLDTSMLTNTVSSEKTDLFTNPSIYSDRNASDTIDYVKVYWRTQENTSNCRGRASIYVGGTQYDGDLESYYGDWTWKNHQWDVNPADSEAWEISDFNGLEFGFIQEEDTGSSARTSETYVIIGYTPGNILTATGISSGEHTVKVVGDYPQWIGIMRPSGAGTYTEFEDLVGAATHWEAVDEVTPDDAATHVGSDVANARDTFALTDVDVPDGYTIEKVIVYEWVRREGINDDDFYVMVRSNITDSQSSTISNLTDTWVRVSEEWVQDPDTSATWTESGVNAMEAGARVATGVDVSQVYVKVWASIGASTYKLYIDDVLEDSTALTASVVDNSNIWYLIQNGSMSLLDFMKIEVDGVLELWYDPVTVISGTTLVDREGSSDGTITYGGRFVGSGTTIIIVDSELTQADDYWNGYTLKVVETTDHNAPEGEEVGITDFTLETLSGTADSGSTTTLVDTALTQPDDFWNGTTITIITTTDGEAPQGESKEVSGWVLSTNTLTFPAMTAVVDTGDTYSLTCANTLWFGALTTAVGDGDRYEIWNGTEIVWGCFPEDIKVEVGALVAYVNPVSEEGAEGEAPEVYKVPPTQGFWWGTGGAVEDLPLYPLFERTATQLGWTPSVLYAASSIIVAVGAGAAVLLLTGSALGALGAVGIGMFAGTAIGVLEPWVVIVYGVFAVAWLYVSRSV